MARIRKTAQEFIQESFSPIIAVLNGPRVENIVSKNNLSFSELLQPFAVFDSEGQFREPNGTVCVVKNLKLVLRDVNWKPLQPIDARRLLNNAVSSNYNDNTVLLQVGNKKLNLPQCTVWFDSWRETYFDVQFPSDHEFSKHFVACMLIGTTLDENIVETFNNLNQQFSHFLTVTPPKLPKWFNSNVLKTYVLLHDVSAVPKEKADAMFDTMKQNFDASHCYMLSINSRSTIDPTLSTDYWKQYIKRSDDTTEGKLVGSNTSTTPQPPEPPQVLPSLGIESDDSQLTIPTQTDISHPLLHSDNELYDNANSLQSHSYSGSSESVHVLARGLDLSTEIHGAALNAADVDAIKKFIQDYISKGLLPYFERQASLLSDAASNRKGVSRSLLSATKRWFGTNKAGSNTGNNTVIYSSECPELQLRRLGDLWMMCGQWQRAFDTYHTAKREFYADGAWLCYAGALEMAALSAFMAGDANRKTHGYMDESIVTYLNTCRMVQFAVRATLLSALCLSSSGQHGEAAKQLIRMTSEDSDLRSAMLLEQAALCFVQGNTRPMCRKYAFHMVLAGHRFSKAGQKKHAFRCYKQAYEVYESSGWRLAREHAQVALGRLAGALRRSADAARWLALPLAPGPRSPHPAHSPHSPHPHRAALRDYMLAHQNWIANADLNELPSLPVPLIDRSKTALVTAGPAPIASPGRVPASSVSLYDDPEEVNNKQWHKMEEMLLQAAQGAVPMIFKPTINLYTSKLDESPTVPQGEPIQISITLKNPITVPVLLSDLELIWKFLPNPDETGKPGVWLCNEPYISKGIHIGNNIIVSQKIKTVLLEGEHEEAWCFSFTPMQIGQVIVLGVAFKVTCRGEENDSNDLTISGKLPFGTEGSVVDPLKGVPKRLQITVGPCAPCLQMTFTEMSPTAVSGEMRSIEVEFRNVGPVDMANLHIAVSHPDCLQLIKPGDPSDNFRDLYDEKYSDASSQGGSEGGAWRSRACGLAAARQCGAVGAAGAMGALPRGGCARAALLLRARSGRRRARLLAYYEPAPATPPAPRARYRLLRHVFKLQVHESVEVTAIPHRNIAVIPNTASEKLCLTAVINNISDDNYPVAIELLEISMLSRQWQLTNLVAARDKTESLAPREKMHIVLEGSRLYKPPEVVHASRLQISSNCPESQHSITDPPYSKFVVEYKNYFIEDDDYGLPQKRKKGLIESMLITRWRSKDTAGRTVIGQTCTWIDCFAKPSLEKESINLEIPLGDFDSQTDIICRKKLENAVIFKLEHTSHIGHNFKETKICKIPVTINIVNCYDVPVKVFIDMSKKKENSSQVGWAGALSSNGGSETGISVSLAELESRRVSVIAACAAPGTYLLGSAFTLTSQATNSAVINSHLCNNSSLLVVTDA